MKMRKNIVVLDLEVSKNYFLIGMKLLETGKVLQIDTQTTLTKEQKDTVRKILTNSTLITFNGLRYDMPILLRALSQTITTKDIFEMSKRMIEENIPPYRVYNEFDIDTMRGVDHIDLNEPAVGVFVSLKGYGARMHSKKLQDLPYAYDKVLTDEEIDVIRKYNINDLDTTIDLFNAIRDRIELRVSISEQYGLDMRSKSDAQIANALLDADIKKQTGSKPRKPPVPKTVKYIPPSYITFESTQLNELLNFVSTTTFDINQGNGNVVLPDELKKLDLVIGGVKYTIGIGGIHSVVKKMVIEPKDDELLIDADVQSMYPSIIIQNNFLPKHIGKPFLDVYTDFYNKRLDPVTGAKAMLKKLKKELSNASM